MLRVCSPEDKADDYHNGTCSACTLEIKKRYYWRCPNSVCGDKDKAGRLCEDCYKQVVDKSKCVGCRTPLASNVITDPSLFPYILHEPNKTNVNGSFVVESLKAFFRLGLFQSLLDYALTCPMAVSTIRNMAIGEWYLFSLDQLKLLYSKLEPAIILRLNRDAPYVGWKPVFEAAKRRPEWLLPSARWLIEWRDQRHCVTFADLERRSEVVAGESELLAICETPEEFWVLRELASGKSNHHWVDFDVIMEHLRFGDKCRGKPWVLDRLLDMVKAGDKETTDWCLSQFKSLARMFPCQKLYDWAAKNHIVVTQYHIPDFDLALRCGIAPILYGCHSKGMYAQTNRLTLEPIAVDRHADDKELFISPDIDQRFLYVDGSSASMRLDWLFGGGRKYTVWDAKDQKCRVDICDDGVEIYLNDEQLLIRDPNHNLPVKIIRFASLTLRSARRNKRKFRLLE